MPFVLPGVVKIPRRNSFLEGAMLEPVNTVLKAVNRLSLLGGDRVLVAGQGPIGLMFTRLLVLRGMSVLATDLFASRLRLAKSLGVKFTFQVQPPNVNGGGSKSGVGRPLAEFVEKATAGKGLDAAVIAVPSDAVVRESQALVRGAGQVLLFSHTKRGDTAALDLAEICIDEKDLIGSYSADFSLQSEVARLVFSRKLDTRQLITHQFPLEQTAAAVEQAAHPSETSLKVVVNQLPL
jgi:L-iditol 2-dehydrogenase